MVAVERSIVNSPLVCKYEGMEVQDMQIVKILGLRNEKRKMG